MATEDSIKYRIISPSETFPKIVTTLLEDSFYELSSDHPHVVVVDKALPYSLRTIAQGFQGTHPSPRLVLVGATLSKSEVLRFQSEFTAFVTKDELPLDLDMAIEAASGRRRYLSPNVAQLFEEVSDDYLDQKPPRITENMIRALRYKVAGHGGKTTQGFDITAQMAQFKRSTETTGSFAPFRAAIHLGLIEPLPQDESVEKTKSLIPEQREAVGDYLRYKDPRYGYRNPHPQAVLYNNRVNSAKSILGTPTPFALMCLAVNAGIVELDEVGTK